MEELNGVANEPYGEDAQNSANPESEHHHHHKLALTDTPVDASIAEIKSIESSKVHVLNIHNQDTKIANSAMRKVSWRVIPLLALAVFSSDLQKTNIGYAAVGLKEDLDLNNGQLSFALSTVYLSYSILMIPMTLCTSTTIHS